MDSQETLRLLGRDKQTFAEWLGDQPAEFIAAYSKPVKDFSAVWLAGPRGCGKTHLLHAAAHAQNGLWAAGLGGARSTGCSRTSVPVGRA